MKNNSVLKCFLIFLLLIALILPAHATSDWVRKWSNTTQGGVTSIAVGDISNDTFPEIVVATTSLQGGLTNASSWLYVFDELGTLKWGKKPSDFGSSITSLVIGDLDGDSKNEVIVGSGATVYFFDGFGKVEQKIIIPDTRFGVTNILIADVNNDKINEIVIAGRTGQSGAIYVYNNKNGGIFNTDTRDIKQQLTAFYAGDLNNDGKYEYVVGTKWNSLNNPTVYEYNYAGTQIRTSNTQGAVTSLSALDIDGDNLPEVLAGGNGFVDAFDSTGMLKKNVTLTGDIANKLAFYDLDKDGKNEIIASGIHLYLLDKNLNKKWVSDSTFSQTYALNFYDLNKDGFPEILVAGNGLHILNKDGKETDTIFPDETVKDFVLADLSGDGNPEIVLGTYGTYGTSGQVYIMQNMVTATNPSKPKNGTETSNPVNSTSNEKTNNITDANFNQTAIPNVNETVNAGGDLNASKKIDSVLPQLDANIQTLLLFGGVGVVLLVIIVYLFSVVRKKRRSPNLKLVLSDDDVEDSILDEVDKAEEIKSRRHPKKVKEKVVEKSLEEKKKKDEAWIGVRTFETEKQKVEKAEVIGHKEDPNYKKGLLPGLKEKKRLEKITKDGFRGLGVSLVNMGVSKSVEMKKSDEEDISD